MSVHRPTPTAGGRDEHLLQLELQPIGSSSSSSWRRQETTNSSSLRRKSKVEEADEEDLFTVPDVEARPAAGAAIAIAIATPTNSAVVDNPHRDQSSGKRRRGRNPVDKEHKRIKRLLRNRVSAQQARERKKVYVNELESRALELHDTNSKLEEKISTLVNENTMLRKILMNTRPKPDENADLTKKQ